MRRSVETGADAVVTSLQSLGVECAFGLPGVHNLAIWEAFAGSPLRLIGVRHEQTAAYAADGLARSTGRLGVAISTTGPGAANMVCATGEAWVSSAPVLVIVTDIPTTLRRPGVYRGVLHEIRDQASMFSTVTKATLRATCAEEIGDLVLQAGRLALTAPTRPVYLEIPTDLLNAPTRAPVDGGRGIAVGTVDPDSTPGRRDVDVSRAVAAAAELLTASRRPLLWAGAGAVRSGADGEVARLAEQLGAPVIETYAARGLLPPGHPSRVGAVPHFPAVGELWDAADVVVAIGTDFDGTMTQNWQQPQPPALVAINVDGDDAAKNYTVDVLLEGDGAQLTGRLADALAVHDARAPWCDLPAVHARLRTALESSEPAALGFVDAVAAGTGADVTVITDMCIAGYWLAALHPLPAPRRLLHPLGWGTLGFAFPASVGVAAAGQPALCVCGDGGFLFACGELAVLAQERLPVTVLIVDDGGYGMLRYDQQINGPEGQRYGGVDLATPDFERLTEAFGIRAERVAGLGAEVADALARHLALPEPSVIVVEGSLNPPLSTSARWYRSGAQSADNGSSLRAHAADSSAITSPIPGDR